MLKFPDTYCSRVNYHEIRTILKRCQRSLFPPYILFKARTREKSSGGLKLVTTITMQRLHTHHIMQNSCSRRVALHQSASFPAKKRHSSRSSSRIYIGCNGYGPLILEIEINFTSKSQRNSRRGIYSARARGTSSSQRETTE